VQGYGAQAPPGTAGAPYGPQGQYGGPYGYRPPPALRPGIIPLRPLQVSDILDGTIKLIRSNPKATLGLSALVAAVASLPVAVSQAIFYRAAGPILTDPGTIRSGDIPTSGLLAPYAGLLVSLIVQFLAVTVLTGVLVRILGRAVFGGRISVGEAWALTRSRVPTLFALALLTTLILVGPLVPIVLLIVTLATVGSVGAAVAIVLLSIIGYVVYVLFFTTRLALSAPAVVLEGRGVVDAMRRSWRLVKGAFWRVLGILVLTDLLVGLIGFVVSIPFSIIKFAVVFGGAGSTGSLVVVAVVTAISGTISAMITYPVQAGVNGLLYADRRMRAEAFDLVLQTAAIDQQRLGWVPASADDLWHPSNAAGGAPGSPPGPPYGSP
jgi:preprotein translocase subunit Sss1